MNFEQIKSIPKNTQYAAYGFIRRCQSLLPSDDTYFVIPSLVQCTILLFYNDFELFQCNQSKIFRYVYSLHGNYFKVFGMNLIERKYTKEYEWKIGTTKFEGRFGLINDTNNASKSEVIKNGSCYWLHSDVINVGTVKGVRDGTEWGSGGGSNLDAFIENSDVITIKIDFVEDNISFTSDVNQRTITRNIKQSVECVRFVCECCACDSEIKFLP